LLWPAVLSADGAQLLALVQQLEQSEWWPSQALSDVQQLQLGRLLEHAQRKSSFYRARFGDAVPESSALHRLPTLGRRELLTYADSLRCSDLGPEHGGTALVQTSGSTGEIVQVTRTAATQRLLLALGLRVHAWHRSDFRQTLAAIRADSPTMDDEARAKALGWGAPATLLYRTGPGYALPIATSVADQAAWLLRRRPGYLLTYPNNLAALLDHAQRYELRWPELLAVRSMGETLTPELRARCREVWRVPVLDVYSSQEVGIIAIECPESGLYHVMSESLIVELLREDGTACAPGEVGRVIVTDLHNFASPLIRYDIGDRAQLGPSCPCGRGLPTLARVAGRERHLVTLPDGSRHWPIVGMHHYRRIAPIVQYQAIQESLDTIELRLVTEAPLSSEQEAELRQVVRHALGHAFEVKLSYFDHALPRPANGKLEEFLSRVPRADG
jgi:phenylacetate-CoA ligase